jgi:3-(3-hydroxy-phenyl)propionate hydroxylase
MRFFTGRGRCFAVIDPRTDEFGWPRRNAFIQPLADAVMADGLRRFPRVQVRFAMTMTGLTADADGVTVRVADAHGAGQTLRARYVVGSDGGRSAVRKALGIAFEGRTAPNRWVVMDLLHDPIGTPGVHFNCDAQRPHVSIALPHGVRRLEFMLTADEAKDDVVSEALAAAMLARVMAAPGQVERIRTRVYTHNGRLAARFRQGRVLLAGDAAHVMPVWQGQGYNSGIRDAFNLGWKLAMVLRGTADDALLDSYEAERREHARAMIMLSETAGRIFAPGNAALAWLRDAATLALNALPAVKRYFLEMRFKPMPRYRLGALHYDNGFDPASPVGTMFIQPRVDTMDADDQRLDDVLGPGFAVIAWGIDPSHGLSAAARGVLATLAARLFCAVPSNQLAYEAARSAETIVLADRDLRLKAWFEQRDHSVVILRPDRFVAAACQGRHLSATLVALGRALRLTTLATPAG